MKIKELKANDNADLIATVKHLDEVKQIKTKFGTQTTLTVAMIEDDSGEIKLNLWGLQSDGIDEGKVLEIKNGFVKEFKGERNISVGRNGSIKVVE